MSMHIQIRDKGQIVTTLRVLDESIVQGDGITYADVDADALLGAAAVVSEGRAAVMAPAPDDQLVSEADKQSPEAEAEAMPPEEVAGEAI